MEMKKNTLEPIIKWAGGKEKELKYILPNVPDHDRYMEPFVGGGSVFMAMEGGKYLINDFSDELISLYRSISGQNADFFSYVDDINSSWIRSEELFSESPELISLYREFREGSVGKEALKARIEKYCDGKEGLEDIVKIGNRECSSLFMKELRSNLNRKMGRMRDLEIKRNRLPEGDLEDNILTAIKSAVYMVYRTLYNQISLKDDEAMHCALFFFIRNYSYSGMFRYNASGEFNVPYGGIAYNSKKLEKKIAYYRSPELLGHFRDAEIYNLDFEDFLRRVDPSENDFIFLDPPYDSEFSTYAQNEFGRDDQKRLADWLTGECRAKWMMIIKYTDFIFSLYDREGIFMKEFDKEYLVSFMNRNNRKTTHLLITNYPV